jgi:hypothetical protein
MAVSLVRRSVSATWQWATEPVPPGLAGWQCGQRHGRRRSRSFPRLDLGIAGRSAADCESDVV